MWSNAIELVQQLRNGDIKATSVMNEVYDRIARVNPEVNAIVNLLDREAALRLAEAADATPLSERGPLHGLPWATKDAVQVAGFPFTQGFKPFADRIPDSDDAFAARLRAAGVIFIGRTNMPEFGLGSNTFNPLFGATRNPFDTSRTAGGSSGGAAVALATGMLPLADGSDMGGSLRNPASYNNVVGFRPSMGRTPCRPGEGWHARLGTTGPMARTVSEVSYLFAAMAGPDPADPLTLPEPGEHFLAALESPLPDLSGLRIAVSEDLGYLPVESGVREVIRNAATTMAGLGADIVASHPPLESGMDIFQVQRAAAMANLGQRLDIELPDWREHAKATAIWNIDKGLALSASDIRRAETDRARLYARSATFFGDIDALILPAAQLPPFPLAQEYPVAIDGVELATYIDWMAVCCAVTVTGYPAISVPAGFSAGLPVGLQIVAPARADLSLLRIARCFEQATGCVDTLPAIHAFKH